LHDLRSQQNGIMRCCAFAMGDRMRRLMMWLVGAMCMGAMQNLQALDWSGMPELEARAGIQKMAEATYRSGDEAELDKRMAEFVRNSSRTSSGLWVSGLYYLGVESTVVRPRPQTDAAWDALERKTLAWTQRRPASAIARLVHAKVIVDRAWQIRGGGYASTVPGTAWKPFHDGLRRAEAYLKHEKAVAGTVPEYYLALMTIAKGLSKPRSDVDALLEECDRTHPAYYPVYFAVLDYLLPKWHGDAREIELFARAAVLRTQQKEGDSMYARIYWYAAQADFEDNLFWATNAQWELMKSGFDDVVARYPDQWNYQNYAHFACEAGDARTLTRLLSRHVHPPIFGEAWSGQVGFEDCERLAGRLSL
jgi:hypothetical protein